MVEAAGAGNLSYSNQGAKQSTVSERRGDEAAIPYQLLQPAFMSPDIVHLGVLDK